MGVFKILLTRSTESRRIELQIIEIFTNRPTLNTRIFLYFYCVRKETRKQNDFNMRIMCVDKYFVWISPRYLEQPLLPDDFHGDDGQPCCGARPPRDRRRRGVPQALQVTLPSDALSISLDSFLPKSCFNPSGVLASFYLPG